MRLVSELTKKDLTGKRVLLRADFDVPIKNGEVTNTLRLEESLPTIKFLLAAGAKVTILSHLGRRGESLKPVEKWLKKKIKNPNLEVLENLRRNIGEEGNDLKFAKHLAKRGDIYVNDAFAASHREHASIVSLPKLMPAYAGLHLAKEVKALSALTTPAQPLVLVVGGAKFESKLPLIKKFLPKADNVFIGGALANLFFKRLGYEVGKSYIDPQSPSITTLIKSAKLILPVDVMVKRASGAEAVVKPEGVKPGDTIVDIGPVTVLELAQYLSKAKTVILAGPMGVYELGYKKGTADLAQILIKSRAKTIVGGGDIVAVIESLGLRKKFFFVSTGGGAMLQFLATGTLPGIKALK